MITIEVYQVTKQDNDSYSAGLNFIEDGRVLKNKTVNAFTKEEFKDKIRVFKEIINKEETDKQTLLNIVQTAINEVMAEEE